MGSVMILMHSIKVLIGSYKDPHGFDMDPLDSLRIPIKAHKDSGRISMDPICTPQDPHGDHHGHQAHSLSLKHIRFRFCTAANRKANQGWHPWFASSVRGRESESE